MQGIIVLAVFMLLWKGLDTGYNVIVNWWQYQLEKRKLDMPPAPAEEPEEEPEKEQRQIGFNTNLLEVDDE